MRKIFTILILSLTIIGCDELSKEELIIHKRNVISGTEEKKDTLDKILLSIEKKQVLVDEEYEDVISFKIGRSISTKKKQITTVQEKAKQLRKQEQNVKTLKKILDNPITFDFQSNPKRVLQKVFAFAQAKNLKSLIYLVDPYSEYDSDVASIGFMSALPIEQQQQFIEDFQYGLIFMEPIIKENTATIDFRFGSNGKYTETMKLIKRNESWYLLSF